MENNPTDLVSREAAARKAEAEMCGVLREAPIAGEAHNEACRIIAKRLRAMPVVQPTEAGEGYNALLNRIAPHAGAWTDCVKPLAAKFELAAQFDAEATWNAVGSTAMAELMLAMARIIDTEIVARAALSAPAPAVEGWQYVKGLDDAASTCRNLGAGVKFADTVSEDKRAGVKQGAEACAGILAMKASYAAERLPFGSATDSLSPTTPTEVSPIRDAALEEYERLQAAKGSVAMVLHEYNGWPHPVELAHGANDELWDLAEAIAVAALKSAPPVSQTVNKGVSS